MAHDPRQRSHRSRVAVLGAGNVGTSFAHALVLPRLASELVLIDVDALRAEGEAMDLADPTDGPPQG